MGIVVNRIATKGETPFLHVLAENKGAIALYETLGFRFRAAIKVTLLGRA